MNDTCRVIVIFRACKYFHSWFPLLLSFSRDLLSFLVRPFPGERGPASRIDSGNWCLLACVRIIIIHVPTSSVRQINREEIWRCMRAAYTVITIVLLFAFFTLSTFLEKIKFCSSLYFFFSRRILFPSQYFWVVRTASSFLSITC